MRNTIIILCLCLLLSGCATSKAVGSKDWHKQRRAEIEDLYEKGEITTKEYIQLKNETDTIQSERTNAILRGVLSD